MAGDIEIAIASYQKAIRNNLTGNEAVSRNDELICDLATSVVDNEVNSNNPLNELHEVFSNISVKGGSSSLNDVDSLLLNTDVLSPLPLLTSADSENGKNTESRVEAQNKSRFSDLDKLSEDLLKEQLDAIHEKKALSLTKL